MDTRFDLHQFNGGQLPVSSGTRLGFEDMHAIQSRLNKLFKGRSNTPPSWAIDLKKLSLLLARYLELRAMILAPRVGSPENRIVFAQRKILAEMPTQIARLKILAHERMTEPDAARRRVLEVQIRTLDGKICIDQRGPALICGIVYYFFRCGWSSPETALALKNVISPQAVRQIACRLKQLWQKMQDGRDRKPAEREFRKAKRRAYYHLRYRQVQIAKEKAARAAETPEQREARLKYHHDYYYANRERIRAQQKQEQDQRREERRFAYANMTPEQRAAKKAYNCEWNRTHRAERAAYKKKEYARLTPAQHEQRRAYQRRYRMTHREQCRATKARHLAKRKESEQSEFESVTC